ncbi:MAG: NYN domain-containing protein [Candidatus Dormibacteria bacterium]
MSRFAVFIDGAYLSFMLRDEFPQAAVDFERLVHTVAPSTRELLRAYYYDCPPHVSEPSTEEERTRQRNFDRFRQALERIPRFEVRLGKLARRTDGRTGAVRYEQKRVDLLLGIDIVRLASKRQIDELVIVAGDSDFVPALQVAKEEGVLCRLYHGKDPHRELRQVADECCRIDAAFVDAIKRLPGR